MFAVLLPSHKASGGHGSIPVRVAWITTLQMVQRDLDDGRPVGGYGRGCVHNRPTSRLFLVFAKHFA